MIDSSIEVGLFSSSASGVRLIGRTGDQAAIKFVSDRIVNPENPARHRKGELTPLRDVLAPIMDTIEREIASRSGFVGAIRDDERILSQALDEITGILDQDCRNPRESKRVPGR